ncbi:MAG TPA: tyrosine-type recombinase/integrase, partial [Polyangiaceae bacterium]|nr:tyrosine-type recombinase/integrase [Polyangiaceae bacterium]
AALTERIRERGLSAVPNSAAMVSTPTGEMFGAYVRRWLEERERRGLSSVGTDRGRLDLHVHPLLEGKSILEIARDDVRAVVEHLDELVRSKQISWRTAQKAWGLVTKLFSDACESKTATLRVRADNPALGVRGPDRGDYRGKQWLYPQELTAVLGCSEVPLRWRRLYALATYLYLRPGELAALEWSEVNSEHGLIRVHQALDLRTGAVKATKTGISRRVPIPLALRPLVDAMRKESGGVGRVVQHTHENKDAEHGMPPLEDLAATLRDHLWRAGVRRAELHEDRPTTKRVTFYDLRATGITWEVLDGTEHVRIMQRAGHKNFSTTQGYIREAEAVGLNVGTPFPPLPVSLLQSSNESSTVDDSIDGPALKKLKTKRPQRVLERY